MFYEHRRADRARRETSRASPASPNSNSKHLTPHTTTTIMLVFDAVEVEQRALEHKLCSLSLVFETSLPCIMCVHILPADFYLHVCVCVCACVPTGERRPEVLIYFCLSQQRSATTTKKKALVFFLRAERSWSVLCSLPLSHTRTRCSCVTELSVRFLLVQQQSFFFAKAFCDPRDDLGRSEVKCGSSRTDVLSCRRRCASSVEKRLATIQFDRHRQFELHIAKHTPKKKGTKLKSLCNQ